jgi:UDP-glucose 4-epimerase
MGELMTVLVTGGASYMEVTRFAMAEAGESVVVVDNSTGSSAFVPEGVLPFIGDAGDENLVEGVIAAHGVKSIVFCRLRGGAGSEAILAGYRNNTMTTRGLLNAAVARRQPLHSPTAAVCGNPQAGSRKPPDPAAVTLRLRS